MVEISQPGQWLQRVPSPQIEGVERGRAMLSGTLVQVVAGSVMHIHVLHRTGATLTTAPSCGLETFPHNSQRLSFVPKIG